MKFDFLFSSFLFLFSSAIVALARWLHHATFSLHVLTVLLMLFTASAVVYLWRHE